MRVTTAEFIKNYGSLADKALMEPVTITKNGRMPGFAQLHAGALKASQNNSRVTRGHLD